MSVYNEEEEWLIEAIESIIRQTHSKLEFVIVLDNPENEVLKSVLKYYQQEDLRINLIINEKNLGLVESLNKALVHCNGSYIARMDADDISYPDRLQKQLKFIVDNNLDLIGSNVKLFKNDKEYFYTTNKLLTHKYLKKLLSVGTIGIVHPTFFVRKEVYDKLNGYKAAYHAEDQEFLARTIYHGYQVGNMSEVLLDCRYNDESITKSKAIYVYRMAAYVVEVFNASLKSGSYDFDDNFYSRISFSEKEKINFNEKQVLLGEARGNLHNKKYIRFFINIIKATYLSPTVFTSVKINLFLRYFKLLEGIKLKGKSN